MVFRRIQYYMMRVLHYIILYYIILYYIIYDNHLIAEACISLDIIEVRYFRVLSAIDFLSFGQQVPN